MTLYFDVDSRKFVSSPGVRDVISELEFKRGDNLALAVRFVSGVTVIELAVGATGKMGFKEVGVFDGDLVGGALSWVKTGTGTSTVYTFDLNLNTAELNTLLGVGAPADVPSVLLNMEMEYIADDQVTSSNTILATVHNDVNRAEDETPLSLPTPEEWLEAQGVAYIQRLSYDPLDADQDGVNVTGTLGFFGDPLLNPGFLPEISPDVYVFSSPDGTAAWVLEFGGISLWVLTENIAGATWELVNSTAPGAYTPIDDTTGTATVALATRPKTTGDFCVVDDGIRPATLWVNDGDDTTPAWRPLREGYANATHASGPLVLTAANAGSSRIITSTGASGFTIVPTLNLPVDPNNSLVWILHQGGAGAGTVDDSGITVASASGTFVTNGQYTTMIVRQIALNSYVVEGDAP